MGKVCLINPPTSREQDELFFPMGLVVLGTLLKDRSISVEIVDFDFLLRFNPKLRDSYEAFHAFAWEKIEESQAEVIGISSICSNFPVALMLAKVIREKLPAAKIVLGGPQPSSVPKEILEQFPFIDAVVIGEAERTFPELLASDWSPDALAKITGLAFRHGDIKCVNPPRVLIDDLDELPIPNFSLLDLKAYFPFAPLIALLEAGRGCPFRCNFCSTAEMWSRKYRAKSPGRILEEMRILNRDYGLKHFNLTHDNFTTSPKYVRKFCEYFTRENREGFTWSSSARTDTLKREDLAMLRNAGCRSLFFGVDSGSTRVQDQIDKHLDLEEYREILSETVRQGIGATASFIVGFPGETREDVDDTLALGLWSKTTGAADVQIHRLSPLASTRIYHDYLPKLIFEGFSSDLSIPLFFGSSVTELVQSSPALFSSYYSVSNDELEPLNMLCLANFFTVVTNRMGPSLDRLLQVRGQSPAEFYEDWRSFVGSKAINVYDPQFIMETVHEFV